MLSIVKDLHELLNDINISASQQRLDALAVILGMLGIAGLFNDVYTNYTIEDHDEQLVIVPAIVTTILVLIAAVVVILTRSSASTS